MKTETYLLKLKMDHKSNLLARQQRELDYWTQKTLNPASSFPHIIKRINRAERAFRKAEQAFKAAAGNQTV